jgi:hypothetical protein
MKTSKTVVHDETIALAQQRIALAVADIPCSRVERQGTKTRLFGPTGPAVVEYRATTWKTCMCTECKNKRELEHLNIQREIAWKRLNTAKRLFVPRVRRQPRVMRRVLA